MASIQQRSRYPRPLKATHSFTGPVNGSIVSCSAGHTPSSAAGGSGHTLCSSLPTSPNGSGAGGRRVVNSPERKSPVTTTLPIDTNPRRSNSMGSLFDPNTCWATPNSEPEPQNDCEEASSSDTVVGGFSHKRSSSCSFTEHMAQSADIKSEPAPAAVHTCMSIEGLNQEISLVLEGKPSMMSQHPDGHIAPVRDLLGHLSMGGTPPHLHAHPSSQSPSPYAPPITASPSSHTHISDHSDTTTGSQTISFVSRDSPGTSDYQHHHPSSPKPSFAREPPDSAERCVMRQETRLYSADFIQKGPDRSKGNISFKGTAFSPLLDTPSLPVGGVQC